ncbi:MAG: amidophosphoribosyltransferase [Spirochaetes bacterium]|nr:amidophosphoribosyltransferase [Spirochaetota bacterium]
MGEECGIFGITNNAEASNYAYLGLHGLQHRGQESCGIVTAGSDGLRKAVGKGKVGDFFTEENLKPLTGTAAIGHVRYSTTGGSNIVNAQPLVMISHRGSLAVGLNGNLVNAKPLREKLEAEGSIFHTTTDSEIIIHLMARSREKNTVMAFIEAIRQIEGAYCYMLLTEKELIAVRDPHGIRPLSIGKLGDSHVIASETSAFDIIAAEHVRDVAAGEVISIDLTTNELRSDFPFKETHEHMCLFEYVYFAKPSSDILGKSVHSIRYKSGITLAKEYPAKADLVIPVPDSGVSAALGFSDASGIPFTMGLVRSHYVGRTFIEPSQSIRGLGVRLKFAPIRKLLDGKRIVLIEDSIVRGTTSLRIIKMLRSAGVKEVHMRIASPMVKFPCFYGIDFGTYEELIANKKSVSEIAEMINADSLGFISLPGLREASGFAANELCDACFSGRYPVAVEESHSKLAFEV